jgi:hypothetical protein
MINSLKTIFFITMFHISILTAGNGGYKTVPIKEPKSDQLGSNQHRPEKRLQPSPKKPEPKPSKYPQSQVWQKGR